MLYLVYVCVLLIWATTPLAIKIGAATSTPLAALSLRILLAFFIGAAIATLSGRFGLKLRAHWRHYLAASLGIFPNFILVYYATETIPSGLVSVMFATSPFVTAVLARPVLGENMLEPHQVVGLLVAIAGLILIFFEQLQIGTDGFIGIVFMLASSLLFSVSNVWVKYLGRDVDIDPVEQTLGAMAFALPGITLCWYFSADTAMAMPSEEGLLAIIYLSLFGSLVGFVAYYYLLRHMALSLVMLIPMASPGLALILGVVIVREHVSHGTVAGAVCIVFALSLHQGLVSALFKRVAGLRRWSL